jgi:hypothetical protein
MDCLILDLYLFGTVRNQGGEAKMIWTWPMAGNFPVLSEVEVFGSSQIFNLSVTMIFKKRRVL